MTSKVRKAIADETGTRSQDWKPILGPESGVGVEYWYQHEGDLMEAYACDDQGHISISIQHTVH
jgi:hypothetical protein